MKKRCLTGLFTLLGILICGCTAKDVSTEATTEETMAETPESESLMDTESYTTETQESFTSEGISFYDLQESSSFYAKSDDSVCVLDASAVYPVITIPERPEVSDKINDAITARLDSFLSFEEENSSYASEEYEMLKDENNYNFEPYTASLSYVMKRCDSQIISLVFSQDDYTGGAHGNHWSYGLTFDAATGDSLRLEALGENSSEFYQMLLEQLTSQSESTAYENFIFDDFSADIEASLLKDSEVWYFDSSGLTFISNPYVLGSYAAGTFEFNIPYSELTGLKENYAYHGKFLRKLFPGIETEYDLNGDGAPDKVCYSLLTDKNFSDLQITLSVNDKDFSDRLNDLHLTNPWTGAYYLMDVDPEDNYVEIAVSNQDYEHEADTFTHFFRYGTDGRLIYQGNIPGVYQEGQDVRYNSNGNLVLCDRSGEQITPDADR